MRIELHNILNMSAIQSILLINRFNNRERNLEFLKALGKVVLT